MMERTIAAVFRERQAADAALRRLLADGAAASDVSMAPAAIAEDGDGPIRQPVTLVAIRVVGDAATARETLESHGGLIVADLATGTPPARAIRDPVSPGRIATTTLEPSDDSLSRGVGLG